MNGARHVPVLCDAFVNAWFVRPDGRYVDCTFGRGGHSRALLSRLSSEGRLLGLDRDPQAVAEGECLAREDRRFAMMRIEFGRLDAALAEIGWRDVDGIGFDLGVSSPQLEEAERGFSFHKEGPLDMRMDPTSGKPLARRLAEVSEKELADIIFRYGDERYSRRIAAAIIQALREGRLQNTRDLENVVFHAVPPRARYGRVHPATRTFQALRIWVNDEMHQLDAGIRAAMRHLRPGGRLVVISFHSGEDQRVRDLIEAEVHPCICPPEAPVCVCGKTPTMRWVQKKPLRPGEEEQRRNPRSRSARMRIAERLPEATEEAGR